MQNSYLDSVPLLLLQNNSNHDCNSLWLCVFLIDYNSFRSASLSSVITVSFNVLCIWLHFFPFLLQYVVSSMICLCAYLVILFMSIMPLSFYPRANSFRTQKSVAQGLIWDISTLALARRQTGHSGKMTRRYDKAIKLLPQSASKIQPVISSSGQIHQKHLAPVLLRGWRCKIRTTRMGGSGFLQFTLTK